MPKLRTLSTIANIIMFVCLLLLLDAQGANLITAGAWKYQDLAAVLLSTVSIIVTFLGIIVALAAIWGYQTLRRLAEEKAVETSNQAIGLHLKSDAFTAVIDETIRERMAASAREAVQDALNPVLLRGDAAPEHREGDVKWHD